MLSFNFRKSSGQLFPFFFFFMRKLQIRSSTASEQNWWQGHCTLHLIRPRNNRKDLLSLYVMQQHSCRSSLRHGTEAKASESYTLPRKKPRVAEMLWSKALQRSSWPKRNPLILPTSMGTPYNQNVPNQMFINKMSLSCVKNDILIQHIFLRSHFQNGRVRISDTPLLCKRNKNPGKNCQNRLFQNSRN